MNAKPKAPLLSIVTVVLNDLAGFRSTEESLNSQVFRGFEWIVVDGGSTDGTLDLLTKPETRATRYISEKDASIYDAMNKGIGLSEGQYVVFLNAGDILPDASVLEKVSEHLNGCDEPPDILFGGATFSFPSGIQKYRAPKIMEDYIWHGLPANHQATYYRRDCLVKTKYDLSYSLCGDYYLVARLYMDGVKATYLDSPLVIFSVGGTSYQSLLKLFLEPYDIQKKVLKLSIFTRTRSLAKRFISTALFRILSMRSSAWMLKKEKSPYQRHKP